MRDNPQHGTGMLGGCWDTDLTRKQARVEWKNAWTRMFQDPLLYAGRDKVGPDQTILER